MLNLKTGTHFRDLTKKEVSMTRGGFIKGILASGIAPSITMGLIANAGSANASVGRGMMRGVARRQAVFFDKKEDSRWAQEVMDKTYPTADIIEEHHNAQYTEELTKTYGGN